MIVTLQTPAWEQVDMVGKWHQGWVGCVHAGQVPGNLHHLLGIHRCDDRGTDCWLGVNYVVNTLVASIIYIWDEDTHNK